MTEVMVILITAAVGFALASWWRVPAMPLLILVGVVLSLTGWSADASTVRNAMLLGLTFLVFVVGTELDTGRVVGHWRAAASVAFAQSLVLGALGFVAARALRFDTLAALYLALALTASSTLMVVTILRNRQQFFEPFGRVVIGTLLIQDAMVVLLLPVLLHLPQGATAVLTGLVATVAMVGLTAVTRQWISPFLVLRMKLDDESMLLVVLGMLFAFVGLAHVMHLPIVTGAFLAGVALSGFPVSGVVRGQVTSLADFFLAVFFVALGALVTWPNWRQLMLEGMLIGGVLLLTPPIVMLILRRAGMTLRSSIESAHLLAQCGEFSLIIVLLGIEQGHVGHNLLAVVVVVSVVTMALTPWLADDRVTWRLMRWIPESPRERPTTPPRDHLLILGCGRHTRDMAARLHADGQSVLVVDDDPGVVLTLKKQGINAVRGDGADYRLLRVVGARQAKCIISTMRRMSDHQRLLRFVSGPKVLVRVFDWADGQRCQKMGATAVVESELAVDEFLRWYEAQVTTPSSAVVEAT